MLKKHKKKLKEPRPYYLFWKQLEFIQNIIIQKIDKNPPDDVENELIIKF